MGKHAEDRHCAGRLHRVFRETLKRGCKQAYWEIYKTRRSSLIWQLFAMLAARMLCKQGQITRYLTLAVVAQKIAGSVNMRRRIC